MFSLRSNSTRIGGSLLMGAGILDLLFAGCTKTEPTGTVQGKVLLNDQPYADSSVVFLSPTTGEGASADIQPGGTFRLDKPLKVGKYTVYLAPKAVAPQGGAGEPMEMPVTIDESVPDKYWNEASSDITIEVTEGENDVTVQLKK